MPTADQTRLVADRARPRLMELWWALRPLTSLTRFMQTGAHPDDETSAMLAALAFRDGINISYACSTRGEGGQNDIGTEAGADLGALRTKEMERACDILGMRMYWHSTSPDDPITDFGFSKSGEETLARWGRDRTILRFAEIIRTERPDIICPTFLDVPGQHGHHRAMTEAAHEVMRAAADPALPTNLPTWQVKKLYLPAWSGAGQAYDDDLPPPSATLKIPGGDVEPISGWSWERLGQQSRAFHRTQGMGRWPQPGASRDWPLHLAESHVDGPDTALWSGLPRTVSDLAELNGMGETGAILRAAGDAITRMVAAFPDTAQITQAAFDALNHLEAARAACPVELRNEVLHRLDAKVIQLGHVLRLSLGVEARAWTATPFLTIGSETSLHKELTQGEADSVQCTLDLPTGWTADETALRIAANAHLHDPYATSYDPLAPAQPRLQLRIEKAGHTATVMLPFEAPPVILPAERASLAPEAAILNTTLSRREVEIGVTDLSDSSAGLSLDAPTGWGVRETERGFIVTASDRLEPGTVDLALRVNGKPASTIRTIVTDHTDPTARARPAIMRVASMDIALPKGRIGYIGAGRDRVGHWLSEMGAEAHDVSDGELANPQTLSAYDTLVIGIFALRFRPGLSDAMPAIHRWVAQGGTLVTLYHRPWDAWDPDTTPPRRLEIGQPSLRWRVTDETAPVTHLAEHPVLTSPNPIGPRDWEGWVKERGLYFAKSWDEAYLPLLEMADPGEAPHRGALLVADIGKGRHVHTSLILHHQMEHLVPGAFRLMANLIAPRE